MSEPGLEKFSLIYSLIRGNSEKINISEWEKINIVLFLLGKGFYSVSVKNPEEILGLSLFCNEFIEDYAFVRSLNLKLLNKMICDVVLYHNWFSRELCSCGLTISNYEGVAILAFAVKEGFVIFNDQGNAQILKYYSRAKVLRLASSYIYLKQCFPNEPLHKTCLRAI